MLRADRRLTRAHLRQRTRRQARTLHGRKSRGARRDPTPARRWLLRESLDGLARGEDLVVTADAELPPASFAGRRGLWRRAPFVTHFQKNNRHTEKTGCYLSGCQEDAVKIRLVGSADLVRAWCAELERAYGIKAATYPSRSNSNDVRAYFDLDDRQAAQLVGLPAVDAAAAATTVTRRRPRTPKLKS